MYHCPHCGAKLEYDSRYEPYEQEPYGAKCTNKKCGMSSDYYWTIHHPYSTERGPGDSFSISYIK